MKYSIFTGGIFHSDFFMQEAIQKQMKDEEGRWGGGKIRLSLCRTACHTSGCINQVSKF